jgi:hypothetical protein
MLKVPGAEVLRTRPPDRVSLSEIRINLEDTLRFRVEPLFEFIERRGIVSNREESFNYLRVQLDYTNRRVQEETGKVQALRDAFVAYQQQSQGTSEAASRATSSASPAGAAQTIMPQLNESFIDSIVRIVTESQDLQYRQKASREIAETVTTGLLPVQAEASYYQNLIASLQAMHPGSPASTDGASLDARYAGALQDVRRAVDQTDDLYRMLSQNLNPGNVVYSLSGPTEYRVVRGVSGSRLALYAMLLFLVAIPAVIAACLFHNRITEENALEARLL